MNFKIDKIELKKGEIITSLYHSPFDYNLFYLLCLAKNGFNIKIILDDVDNLGVDRTIKNNNYSFKTKYFLSKTERTNIRPLSLLIPNHLLANLAYPEFKQLDTTIGVKTLKNSLGYEGKLEHWIRDETNEFGIKSIIGHDLSFAFIKVDRFFLSAIKDAKKSLINILSKFPDKKEKASEFIEWLFDIDYNIEMTISEYYFKLLEKIVRRFNLMNSIKICRMSDEEIQINNKAALEKFLNNKSFQEIYRKSAIIDNKNFQNNFPFYSISKNNGTRLLPINNYITHPSEYIISPKVLMLNNLKNLILPYHAINNKNVFAREIMYKGGHVNCNQIFCDDKWFKWVCSFNLEINLDSKEEFIFGKKNISIMELPKFMYKAHDYSNNGENIELKYKSWIIDATQRAISWGKYPLIFLSLFQDEIFYNSSPDFYELTPDQKY